MSDKEDHIARLSQRFKTHTGGRPKNDQKSRERQSLYLDANLIERVDKTYKEIGHQLYPNEVRSHYSLRRSLNTALKIWQRSSPASPS